MEEPQKDHLTEQEANEEKQKALRLCVCVYMYFFLIGYVVKT